MYYEPMSSFYYFFLNAELLDASCIYIIYIYVYVYIVNIIQACSCLDNLHVLPFYSGRTKQRAGRCK